MKIKVVHVNTFPDGGAATSAFRIHEALLLKGVDSYFITCDDEYLRESLVKQKEEKRRKNLSIIGAIRNRIISVCKNRLNLYFSKKDWVSNKYKKIKPYLDCEIASLPFSEYDISDHPKIKSADIIHLHWVAGIIDYPSFFEMNRTPIVWTLHDMNPILGLFHYENDEIRNNDLAFDLDEAIKNVKAKYISTIKTKLFLVSPSQWLRSSIKSSAIFKNFSAFEIPYCLDMSVFRPRLSDGYKKEDFFEPGKTIFLFVAQSVKNHRKGFDLLIDAFNTLASENIGLLIIGDFKESDLVANVRCLGRVENPVELSKFYSISDAFILPSREDNLPNVMLESFACGTPVISFDIGGMSQYIIDGFNGLKSTEEDSENLAITILNFLSMKEKFERNKISEFAREIFSQDRISNSYVELYYKALSENA